MGENHSSLLEYAVDGTLFARGVVSCLVEAGQDFQVHCLGNASFVLSVAPAAARYLPVGCTLIDAQDKNGGQVDG